jgi:hypothetical protein
MNSMRGQLSVGCDAVRAHRSCRYAQLVCSTVTDHTSTAGIKVRVGALTRQQSLLLGGLFRALAAFLRVPIGHTHGCKPVATAFLSVQVGRQHLCGASNTTAHKAHGVSWCKSRGCRYMCADNTVQQTACVHSAASYCLESMVKSAALHCVSALSATKEGSQAATQRSM